MNMIRSNKMKTCMVFLLCVLSGNYVLATCAAEFGSENDKPDDIYEILGDGTVLDKETGLIWQRCVVGLSGSDCSVGEAATMTGQAALAQASVDSTAGHTDWRLPNLKELVSLTDLACAFPTINTTVFPNAPVHPTATSVAEMFYDSAEHWTSTFGYGGRQYYVGFSVGGVNNQRGPSTPLFVRLVRGGLDFDTELPAACGDTLDVSMSLDLPIAVDSYVSGAELGSVSISGATTCIETGQEVGIVLTDGVTEISDTIAVQPDGKFGFNSLNLLGLEDGPLTITATSGNLAGTPAEFEILPASENEVILDTERATITIADPTATDDRVDGTELSSGVIIAGTSNVENGQVVSVAVGDLETTATVTDGDWSVTVDDGSSGIIGALDISSLDDGEVEVSAEVSDRAGNGMASPESETFTLDLVAPAAPVVYPVFSSTATVSFIYGTFDPIDVVLPVTVTIDGLVFSSADASLTIDTIGGGWYIFNAGPFASGVYDIEVSAEYYGSVTLTDETTDELTVSY